MAIFKRYNTRKKRTHYGLILWILGILAVFIITAIIGYTLGQKAEGGENLLNSEESSPQNGITIAPLAERSVHGEYRAPRDILKFTSADPLAVVSSWLYKDKKAMFKNETDKLLGKDVSSLAGLDNFDTEYATSGFFEISCVYEDEKVRSIIETYERTLISEFKSGPDEIILVFNNVTEENYKDILNFAKSVPETTLICVPYSLLKDELCARFFSEAAENRLTVTLMVKNLKEKQLRADIENFAFYFTKYNVRLLLSGDDANLLDILSENNILNYQFYSASARDGENE